MRIGKLTDHVRIAFRLLLTVLALHLWSQATLAGTTSVTATKDNNTPANVTEAFFSIVQAQDIFWTALYSGSATDGHSVFVSHSNAFLNEFALTTTGGGGGKFHLAPGSYQISIRYFSMGPGSYTVKYDPTGNGANNGDPHITTVDGIHYDFQSAGEFVALRDGHGMEIQTRQTPISTAPPIANPYTGLISGVSLNTAVAARVGHHRVTYQFAGSQRDNGFQIRIDGARIVLPPFGQYLGSGGFVGPSAGGGVRTQFANGTILIVTPQFWDSQKRWYLNLDVYGTPAHAGIMGLISPDGWLPALPNGQSVGPRPDALHDRFVTLYAKFAEAWRVTDKTSLFDYAGGTSTATFTLLDWPREAPPFTVPDSEPATPISLAAAQRACYSIKMKALREDCVFDVQVTGSVGFARNYQQIQKIRLSATAITLNERHESKSTDARWPMTVQVRALAANEKIIPGGTVQLFVDAMASGLPVPLDTHGRATLKNYRHIRERQIISVRYAPAKGIIFLPSIAFAHESPESDLR